MSKPSIDWKKVAKIALLSRELDLLEEEQLAPQGRIKYQFSAKGHELSQVLMAQALNHPRDAASVYYRSRPFMLASGLTPSAALSAGMALKSSPTEGRDTGVVYNMPRTEGVTVLPASGDVGAQYTPAAGWAQAIQYHQKVLEQADWSGAIAVAHGGDGSVAANGFWSALNIATTLRLPLLFFIEDNRYGLSVPASLQTPGGDISANLASFSQLKIVDADGTRPPQAWRAVLEAVNHVRSHPKGPCLLRMVVPRLQGHTFIDDQAYKNQEEIESETSRDPIQRLKTYLSRRGILNTKEWDGLLASVREELAASLQIAEQDEAPDPERAVKFLFSEGLPPKQGGLRPEEAHLSLGAEYPQPSGPRINFVDAVLQTLKNEMSMNPRVLVFGEDVGAKGGVHGATRGLQTEFGAERVFDTSLSEEGIIGRSVGMAIAGLLPVPEIQFRKYADPAYEQLNDLGSIRWRTANKFAAPVVVRIPVGFGKVTGDPWHSVSGEAVFAHMLGWRIAYPSNAEDAVGLLRSALRGDDPTFFLEHRALLDTPAARRPYPGDDFCLPFGKAAQLAVGDELTIITWGETVHRCLAASQNYPERVTLIDLRTIIPWDQNLVLENVRKTGKVLIVHEDTYTAGFGAEISSTIVSEAFTYLDAPIQRLATPDVLIPYSVPMMEAVIPNVEQIKAAIEDALEY